MRVIGGHKTTCASQWTSAGYGNKLQKWKQSYCRVTYRMKNFVQTWLQGIIPDITIRLSGNTPLGIQLTSTVYEGVDSLHDVKTLAPGLASYQ